MNRRRKLETKKMFPNGCQDWGVSLGAYEGCIDSFLYNGIIHSNNRETTNFSF